MATTVYEEAIEGTLDSTVITSTYVTGPSYAVPASAWLSGYLELWDSVFGFTYETVQYQAHLRMEQNGGVVYPHEIYGYVGGISQEVTGDAAGSFSFEASIVVEQDGNDVKVTVTGSLGSSVETFTDKLFIRVDTTEPALYAYQSNAGFRASGRYDTGVYPQNYYGEVTTVDNPTRNFYGGIYGQNGGVAEANWTDWDAMSDTSDAEYTNAYNATGSITINTWPPADDPDYPRGTVAVSEQATTRYSVGLSYNQYTLSVQSTPPTGVSIIYLPTPDDDAEASPQDTNFNIKYGIEDIAFSPSPDIIGQTTTAQNGTFYWVWYQTKYGGTQPDVELTAPGTSGRRTFLRWDYTGGTQEEVLLDWGTLTQDVVCHTHYNYDIQVVAPAINPPGYTWLYWDFLVGDHRLAKLQEFLLDANRTIIATYEEWVAEDAVAMWVDSKQIPFAAATFDGALYIKRRSDSPATWNNAILIDNSSSAGYSNPGIVMTDDSRIIVTALDGDEATVDDAYKTFYSDDMGTIWTGPV